MDRCVDHERDVRSCSPLTSFATVSASKRLTLSLDARLPVIQLQRTLAFLIAPRCSPECKPFHQPARNSRAALQ